MNYWNSLTLQILYEVFGWIAFVLWSVSFYPQITLNYRRKSVVGLNFDYLVLNFTKQSCYLVYNAAFYFSPVIQQQFHDKYGRDEMIPVAANDVAFAIHAVLMVLTDVVQSLIYERGGQRVSVPCIAIAAAIWSFLAVCVVLSFQSHSWFWLICMFNSAQVVLTAIKYIPQACMNFWRESTVGWSVFYIFFDFFGGVTNFAQMGIQSLDQGSLINFYGNVGKPLLCLEVMFFDILFGLQHYVFYPEKREKSGVTLDEENTTPLLKPSSDVNDKADQQA